MCSNVRDFLSVSMLFCENIQCVDLKRETFFVEFSVHIDVNVDTVEW